MSLYSFLNVDRETELKLRKKNARNKRVTKKRLKVLQERRFRRYHRNLSIRDIVAEVLDDCVEAVVYQGNAPKRVVKRELDVKCEVE